MGQLKIIEQYKTLTIESANGLKADHQFIQKLIIALEILSNAVPLKSFDLWVPDSEPNKKKYTYRWIASDGRRWTQVINLTTSSPMMTFSVSDSFSVAEFSPHRAVRDNVVIPLITNYGVTKIACDWN